MAKKGGEKEKFLLAEGFLSDEYRKAAFQTIAESFVYSMSEKRLLEEGRARNILRHPNEKIEQYRIRVARAEEWRGLSGSKKGLFLFLQYLGYQDFEIFPIRNVDPNRWNEYELRIKDTTNRSALEQDYLFYIADFMSPSFAQVSVLRVGKGDIQTKRSFDARCSISSKFVFHRRGSWDHDDLENTDRHQI